MRGVVVPIHRTVARMNRYVLNPVIRRFAGHISPFAILIHTGRRSGREYRTPIMVFRDGDAFVIALTYGRGTDWERNVLNEGNCELVYRGKRFVLTAPTFIEPEEAGRALPRLVRVILGVLDVDDFMRLHTSTGTPPAG